MREDDVGDLLPGAGRPLVRSGKPPMRGKLQLSFYRLPNEMPLLPASVRAGSTRKTELGMDRQLACDFPASRLPISRVMDC